MTFAPETHTYTADDGRVLPSVTQITGMLTADELHSINPATLQAAANRGTAVHEYTELIDIGEAAEDMEIEPDYAGYVAAYEKFTRDYQPDWRYVERAFCNGEYAGTLDRFGLIDGHETVVDIKTTAAASRASKIAWSAQTAAYAMLLELESAPQRWIVRLKSDGTYQLIDLTEFDRKAGFSGYELFADLLNLKLLLKGENK